jgi:hypothetical protein
MGEGAEKRVSFLSGQLSFKQLFNIGADCLKVIVKEKLSTFNSVESFLQNKFSNATQAFSTEGWGLFRI